MILGRTWWAWAAAAACIWAISLLAVAQTAPLDGYQATVTPSGGAEDTYHHTEFTIWTFTDHVEGATVPLRDFEDAEARLVLLGPATVAAMVALAVSATLVLLARNRAAIGAVVAATAILLATAIMVLPATYDLASDHFDGNERQPPETGGSSTHGPVPGSGEAAGRIFSAAAVAGLAVLLTLPGWRRLDESSPLPTLEARENT